MLSSDTFRQLIEHCIQTPAGNNNDGGNLALLYITVTLFLKIQVIMENWDFTFILVIV